MNKPRLHVHLMPLHEVQDLLDDLVRFGAERDLSTAQRRLRSALEARRDKLQGVALTVPPVHEKPGWPQSWAEWQARRDAPEFANLLTVTLRWRRPFRPDDDPRGQHETAPFTTRHLLRMGQLMPMTEEDFRWSREPEGKATADPVRVQALMDRLAAWKPKDPA